jgi:ribose 5-phosphate isomerase B
MHIYLGSDHGGVHLKHDIDEYLKEKYKDDENYSVLDLGVFTNDSSDYPDIAREVSEKVVENDGALGILICGSGVGMSIAANRRPKVRAVLASNELMARLARSHNDANILCMGERFIGKALAKAIVDAFLEGEFSTAERHVRRLEKVEKMNEADRNKK